MTELVTWVFIITLSMPSFGGPVEARFSANNEVSCNKLRTIVARQYSAGIVSEKCYILNREHVACVDEEKQP
jgi:hypothetical protein